VIQSNTEHSADPSAQLRRVENLWKCFMATKEFFETFFSVEVMPLCTYPYISMATFTQMAHCLVVLFRLSTLEAPGIPWDKQRVVKELSFGDVVRTWAKRWDTIAQSIKLDGETASELEEYPWFCAQKTLAYLLHVWDTKILPKLNLDTTSAENGGLGVQNSTSAAGMNDKFDVMDFSVMTSDFPDDTFMREVFEGGLEYFDQLIPDLMRSP
jgi:hypothetical protein